MPTPGIRGLARSLSYWERAQGVSSNNLANINTDAFKAIHLTAALGDDGVSPLAVEQLDLSQGALTPTGNTLDLAIDGPGFFVVQSEAGEQLIRGGSFRLSETGILIDPHGNPLLGSEGPVPVGEGELQITEEGGVMVDGNLIDILRLVDVDPADLDRVGENRFVANGPMQESTGRVLQGALEGANIDAVNSMVEMIRVQRAYQANMTALRSIDDTMATATRIGRVG